MLGAIPIFKADENFNKLLFSLGDPLVTDGIDKLPPYRQTLTKPPRET